MIRELSLVSAAILAATGAGSVAALGIYVVARRRRDTPASGYFGRFALGIAVWNALSAVTFAAPGRLPVLVFESFAAVAAVAATFLWVEFTIAYTGHESWLRTRWRALLWAEPVAYAANEVYQFAAPAVRATESVQRFDGLAYVVYELRSPLTIVWYAVPMLVMLASLALLAVFISRTRGGYQKQAAAIFLGVSSVYVGILVYFALLSESLVAFDPTPALNAVLALLVGVALFRFDFLTIAPLATDQLFEEIPDPVFVVAPTGQVADANEAGASLAEGPVTGRPLSESVPALGRALDEGDDRLAVTADGEPDRTYDLKVSPLTDPYDCDRGRLVILRDVTEQVDRERELECQNERLERFANVVSHDLRNPLNVARGFTREAYDTGDVDHLERSLSAMEDMERLVDDVLTLARQGRTVDETRPADLDTVASDAWPFVDADATLVVESTATVEADPDRLAELLGNCFRNARDHGGDGVTVWVGATPDGFYVEDDGPGVPEDERETVFESGYTTADSGTGLGLSIVANIAEAHGWSVGVESGREGGAKVVVSGVTVRDRSAVDAVTRQDD